MNFYIYHLKYFIVNQNETVVDYEVKYLHLVIVMTHIIENINT